MPGQKGDVFAAFAEGGDLDGEDVQAVVEVFAEAAGGDFFFEVAVGGADDADVGAAGAVFADAFIEPFLEDAEQFALEGQGDFADFIEEEGAAFGGFEAADAVADGAGEGAFGVAEEFAFVQFGGDGGAIDADERFLRPATAAMDFVGDQFLAGAGFAEDQDGGVGGGDEVDLTDDLLEGGALADEVAEGLGLDDFFLEVGVLLFEGGFEFADFLEGPGVGDGAAGIIREDAAPQASFVGDVNADKYADDPKHFAFIRDRRGVQAADDLGFEQGKRGEFAGILVEIRQDHLLAGIGDLAENANAKRYAGKMVGRLSFGVGSEARGGRSGVEAFGLVRAFATAGTIGADVAFVHEPDSGRNDHGAVTDAVHEPFEQHSEFPFLADFQQQVADEVGVKADVGVGVHGGND